MVSPGKLPEFLKGVPLDPVGGPPATRSRALKQLLECPATVDPMPRGLIDRGAELPQLPRGGSPCTNRRKSPNPAAQELLDSFMAGGDRGDGRGRPATTIQQEPNGFLPSTSGRDGPIPKPRKEVRRAHDGLREPRSSPDAIEDPDTANN